MTDDNLCFCGRFLTPAVNAVCEGCRRPPSECECPELPEAMTDSEDLP